MITLGYALSSEEQGPLELVRNARTAEDMGFHQALISDHFHPWNSRQPHSPMVWSVLGGISQSTQKLIIGTGVTCPIQRIHPAIIAQAAATSAVMLPGRFFLGVGTGENLNEHILGQRWAPLPQRLAMLEESMDIMRQLWKGETMSYQGKFFTVEDARIFTLPAKPPAIAVAASGEKAAELAGRIGDALISVVPKKEIVEAFRRGGGKGKPCHAQLTVCWGSSEEAARQQALQCWPNGGLAAPLSTELRCVEHFDQAAEDLTAEQVAKNVTCGPDPQKHFEAIMRFAKAGFDHIHVHQVGPDQDGFFKFYQKEIMPEVARAATPV